MILFFELYKNHYRKLYILVIYYFNMFFKKVEIIKVNFIKEKLNYVKFLYDHKTYEIKKLDPLNKEVRNLIFLKNNSKKIPKFIFDDIKKDNFNNMITVGLFENKILTLTISLKKRDLKDLFKKCMNTDEKSKYLIISFFEKLIQDWAYNKNIYEFSRFSSLKENVVVFRRIFPLVLVFLLYQINIKNSLLIANCNSSHKNFYIKIFSKKDVFFTDRFYIYNPKNINEKLESNLIYFKNIINNKLIKSYFEMLNTYILNNV